jgi:hypothetical protein
MPTTSPNRYWLIGNHGGFVALISEVGRGSIFHIYLPIQKSNNRSNTDLKGIKGYNRNGSRSAC